MKYKRHGVTELKLIYNVKGLDCLCILRSHLKGAFLVCRRFSVLLEHSCPGWCGSVNCMPACEPKGHWFDSQSGHMSGLQNRFPSCERQPISVPLKHGCFAPTLSPSLTLSKKKKKKKRTFLVLYILYLYFPTLSSFQECTFLKRLFSSKNVYVCPQSTETYATTFS